jgi:SAM-dependent methyltransferase
MKEIGWTEKLAKEWHKWKPPSRPSKSEIAIYESWIRRMPIGSNVLILGSTPEIRSAAAMCKLRVTVCDWSQDIYEALKLLMENKREENFQKQDWRTMKFEEKFDMIIGDCATTVVPYKDLKLVFGRIAASLKPNGVAVQRIWVRHKGQRYSLGEIKGVFERMPKGSNWYAHMLFPVFLHYYNDEEERLSGEELFNRLADDCQSGKIPKRIAELFSIVKDHKTPNNVLLKEDMEKLLKEKFEIVRIQYGRDVFSRNAPIYILRPCVRVASPFS